MSAVAAELRRARSIIALPGTWIQGALAEDEFGNDLEPEDDDAVAYCAVALARVRYADGRAGGSWRRSPACAVRRRSWTSMCGREHEIDGVGVDTGAPVP